MSPIRWEEALSIGVEEIDTDHRRLVGMLAGLGDAADAADGPALLHRTIDGLLDYTSQHFRQEEEVMRRSGYPELTAHAAEHADLLRRLEAFKSQAEAGAMRPTLAVIDFLGGWLTNHMRGADKALGLFLGRRPGDAR